METRTETIDIDILRDNLRDQFLDTLTDAGVALTETLGKYAENIAVFTLGAVLEGDHQGLAQLEKIPQMLAKAYGINIKRDSIEQLKNAVKWIVRLLVGTIATSLTPQA